MSVRRRGGAIALALIALLAAAAHGEPPRVLFIGNSYTGVNNLPRAFAEVARSATGAAPEVRASTPGGRTLLQHLSIDGSLRLIDEGGWEVVVLQGQSQEPALAEADERVRGDFLAGATGLCARVRLKSPQARIYFYETWARHADLWAGTNAGAGARALGRDPAEMQARLRKWYGEAARAGAAAGVVPVGEAWALNYREPAPLRLHAKDHSHPEPAGTYLAALVFYGTIYGTTNVAVGFRGELDEATAARLQRLAARTLRGE